MARDAPLIRMTNGWIQQISKDNPLPQEDRFPSPSVGLSIDRRQLMSGMAWSAAGLMVASQPTDASASEHPAQTQSTSYRRIACEEAFAFDPVTQATLVADPRLKQPDVLLAPLRDLGPQRIAGMDAAGIDLQILSLFTPGVQALAAPQATALAQASNDYLADAVRRHPTRFAGLAALAPHAPAEAAHELERAVLKLRLKGALINSHTFERYLDDQFFWPILEAAESLDVPIYIHPRLPPAAVRPFVDALPNWGFSVEVGSHALRLIAAGVFDRFPRLRIVLGHLGEGLPFLIRRISDRYADAAAIGMVNRKIKRTPREYFRDNFVLTTSGMNYAAPLEATLAEIGVENVMFAADYPFEDQSRAVRELEAINISPDVKRKIFQLNAERVFKLCE